MMKLSTTNIYFTSRLLPFLIGTAILLLCAQTTLAFYEVVPTSTNAAGISGAGEGVGSATLDGEAKITGLNAIIYNLTTGIGGLVVWIGGQFLDLSLSVTVIGMGKYLGAQGLGPAIDNIWVLVRDIFNLAFIFGLLYIGFRIILDPTASAPKRTLGTLIAAALLINFSLYFTKVIVDFTNITAAEIYERIDSDENYTFSGQSVGSVTNAFMSHMRLTSYANPNAGVVAEISEESGIISMRVVGLGFMMMIFMLIAGFVFIAAAVMLVARFLALILFMIFSPAMFLGWVFPGFASVSQAWWRRFLGYAFLGPAFVFMLYLSLRMMQGMAEAPGGWADLVKSGSSNTAVVGIILQYALAVGLLYASLLVAKQMGAAGAATSISLANTARKQAQGFVGANTIGRGANMLGKGYDKFQSSQAANSTPGRIARGIANTITLGATSDKAIRTTLKAGQGAKFGSSESFADRTKSESERQIQLARRRVLGKIGQEIASGDQKRIERAFAGASGAQVLELADSARDRKTLVENAESLTADQVKKIMESDKIDDAFKTELGGAVSDATLAKLTSGGRKISDASKTQLKAIGYQKLTDDEVAVRLTSKQLEHVDSEFTESEAADIKRIRKDALEKVAAGSTAFGLKRDDLLKYKPEETSKLPAPVLVELAPDLSIPSLGKIVDNVNQEDQRKIRSAIENSATPPVRPAAGVKPGDPGYSEENAKWDFLNTDNVGKKLGK
jgi:hypothetical protein